ncbi:MAG: GTPase Era, partial [Candidatus Eutrophobiaceae bacterium]
MSDIQPLGEKLPPSALFRCGYLGLLGRPNVGKSTLMNRLCGRKLGIISHKPQTTRWSLAGVANKPDAQLIYVDTPGFQLSPKQALNRWINKSLLAALEGLDAALFMIPALSWTEVEDRALEIIAARCERILLLVNRIDLLDDRNQLLAFLDEVSRHYAFTEIIPISALRGDNIERLENLAMECLPEKEAIFPQDRISDRSEAFLAAEYIREKLMNRLDQELPYRLTVSIESFKRMESSSGEKILHIHALIWVGNKGHKGIVIGKQGQVLKAVGLSARMDLERLFDCKVFLRTWVKVREGWQNSDDA